MRGLCYVCRNPASISFEFWTILKGEKMEDSVYVDRLDKFQVSKDNCDQLAR